MKHFTILCLGVALSGAAYAAEPEPTNIEPLVSTFAEDTGDDIRIESAEYLRTYSQEVAAAACFLYNDIDAEFSRELMHEARAGFDLRLDALLNGNEALGIIGAEHRKKTIAELEKIATFWSDMAAAVDVLMESPHDTDAVNVIKSKNLELFEMTDILVAHIEGEYANPAVMTEADVILLEIVGRTEMMSQKIAKDSCKIFTGNDDPAIKERLHQSIGIYEASLDALLNGMPALGVPKAPTHEIETMLHKVQDDWHKLTPILATLLAGEKIDEATEVYMFEHMVEEAHKLEELSHAYATFSHHDKIN
ncbi:MAG: type IV pili methyl-accepting chemotaxis transducer N-terminal domain-containing protein [Silicimonas sp.]|nr:type IV pili methyl-accepting chemotaxis transducer N-terminal domain-containing protein [Silicimonas sp.]